jgi:dolichol-phosphate mannosyltransferase
MWGTNAVTNQSLLSVIVPVYGCVGTIEALCKRVIALENTELAIEVILVDDSSIDGGREILATINSRYPQCRAILLPRNFGQHWATSRGILESLGDYVVTMDCDLENNPEDISRLLAELSNKNLCVLGSSPARGSRTLVRKVLRRLYGKVLSNCYGNDLIELGFNSFSFAAFDGQFIRNIVRKNSPYDPISIKVLDSGIEIKMVTVETSRNSGRPSGYSVFENLVLAFKSLVLAGKGFQTLCVQSLMWITATLLVSLAVLVWLVERAADGTFVLLVALAAATLFTTGLGLVLALLTSIILSSLNQTRPALRNDTAAESDLYC